MAVKVKAITIRLPSKAQPASVARRVLAGLAKGRAKAIEQRQERAAAVTVRVIELLNEYRADGRPLRGLAGLISRRMGGTPCEAHVRKIISRLLYVVRDSPGTLRDL